ncbi:hypothetical protein QQS21_000077 [Conoideocrella luteorostrata]|uniref:Heterokaryon incompatibility domain-containing protein n=1 Tax=Conoideocrella luteorostrata TaxID=1105319 RepID=A0AAJ0G4A4_9HYPO|nr:hypothetical protein QQS21_000077 [Conoideocrella luteorostrata]
MMASADISPLPFKYNKLPTPSSIRLLQRLNPADDGTLHFSLITQDLNDQNHVPYTCLSYTWGNPFAHGRKFRDHFDAVAPQYDEKNKVRVFVDGEPMFIQRNLHDALSMIPRDAYREYANRPLDGTSGQRYLHIAAYKGRADNVESWFHRGADINQLDDNNHNGLHYAADQGQMECVKRLLGCGCKPDVKDSLGKLPADLAREKGHDEVAALLERASDSRDEDPYMQNIVSLRTIPSPLIWADAICINQGDVAEKSGQVTMMDRIYSKAMYVIAWLGPPDSICDVGMRTLETLSSHLKVFKDSGIDPFSGKDKEKYTEAGIPYISYEDWAALAGLYQRQWFRRAWIVQEAALPEALLMYIGDKAITWRELGQVAEAIRYLEAQLGSRASASFVPLDEPAVSVVWNMAEVSKWRRFKSAAAEEDEKAKEYKSHFALQHLVYNFWTFNASDPRDKVFAYYGLLNIFGGERRNTDYVLTVATVYAMATRELIKSEGTLFALSACVFPLHRRKDIPSWVPDYSLPGKNAVPRNFAVDKGLEYIEPPTPGDPASLTLNVKGYFIGLVSSIGARSGTKPSEKLLFDPTWLTMPLSLRGKGGYQEGTSLSSILWTTLCMDMSSGSIFDPSIYGNKAPAEQGIEFRFFVLLAILAAADGKIRDKLGLETTTKYDLVFSHLEYDPMKQDMEPILADLDAFQEHDGDQCWLPTREEVLRYWSDFRCGLLRNAEVDNDEGPTDFYLPAGVDQKNSRPIGNGYVMPHSRMARRCMGFITAYGDVYGGRHLITVNDKYLGMASLATKPKDEVWVLPGLNAFAVLRPIELDATANNEIGGKRYEFMGSSYIGGMMYGEVVPLLKSKLEDIILI